MRNTSRREGRCHAFCTTSSRRKKRGLAACPAWRPSFLGFFLSSVRRTHLVLSANRRETANQNLSKRRQPIAYTLDHRFSPYSCRPFVSRPRRASHSPGSMRTVPESDAGKRRFIATQAGSLNRRTKRENGGGAASRKVRLISLLAHRPQRLLDRAATVTERARRKPPHPD